MKGRRGTTSQKEERSKGRGERGRTRKYKSADWKIRKGRNNV